MRELTYNVDPRETHEAMLGRERVKNPRLEVGGPSQSVLNDRGEAP
jgi:hypothetical protein